MIRNNMSKKSFSASQLLMMTFVLSSLLVNEITCSSLTPKVRHGTHWNRIGKRFESLSYADEPLFDFDSLPSLAGSNSEGNNNINNNNDLIQPIDPEDVAMLKKDAAFVTSYLKRK